MSRVGKKIIPVPDNVEIKTEGGSVVAKGPKGELVQAVHKCVKVALEGKEIVISVSNPEDRKQRALWGLFRSLVANMVKGVSVGFERKLEISGVGYKAEAGNGKLVLNVGFSHPVEFAIPENIEIRTEKNAIMISGADKQLVGETAAQIRRVRKPEPYKGKGIRYSDEVIRRKAGKATKAVGG